MVVEKEKRTGGGISSKEGGISGVLERGERGEGISVVGERAHRVVGRRRRTEKTEEEEVSAV